MSEDSMTANHLEQKLRLFPDDREAGSTGDQARGRRGLGKMTRRKREIIGFRNEESGAAR